ncbi:hypothetical protein M1328_04895 [Patescibacteria group bacterium]|nr:hypothetical protein [Patescibacteria group bacterium]
MVLERFKTRLLENELVRKVRATMLLGGSDKLIRQNKEYIIALPQIRELYKQAWRWHGTGRYQYSPPDYKDQRDVISEIIANNGLIPHLDPLDYTRGTMYSISTSPSRLYSSLYAQLHFEEGKRLRNPMITAYGWGVFMKAIVEISVKKDRRLLDKKFRQEKGLTNEGTQYFHQKYTKKKKVHMFQGGQSDIKGNYPILIGIKADSFPEEKIAEVLKRHESRSTIPIRIDQLTHIEVPLLNVEEVKKLLKQAGINLLPVIPIEWGEEFSKSLPVYWIFDGKPLK